MLTGDVSTAWPRVLSDPFLRHVQELEGAPPAWRGSAPCPCPHCREGRLAEAGGPQDAAADRIGRHTVGLFPRHSAAASALPPGERARIVRIARGIRDSFAPGRRPVRRVRLVGHADRDPRRGEAFERRVSAERTQSVQQALIAAINRPGIARRIVWERIAEGATRPLVRSPRNEAERRRNRRVDILTSRDPPPAGRRSFLRVRGGRLVGLVQPGQLRPAAPLGEAGGPRPAFARFNPAAVNLREDVLNAMNRLHVLWSLTNADYDREYPNIAALPFASIVDVNRIPRTVAAIVRNQEPTLHHLVGQNILHRPFAQPVGRGLPNTASDLSLLQTSLRALRLLGDADFAREQAAIAGQPAVSDPDAAVPATLTALTRLKDRFAGSELGWTPLQADESEAGGDRYGGRTFDLTVTTLCKDPAVSAQAGAMSHDVSIFIPRGATPAVNKVHVFFSPRGAASDRGDNDVLVQGLRGAADGTDWILIGISGIVNGWRTMDDAALRSCLARSGRPTGIEAVRFSGHSRGVSGMRETMARKLVGARLDGVTVLDAPELLRGGAPRGVRTVVYHVNVAGDVPRATHHSLDPGCMRAIGYTRLIGNAMVTKPYLTLPPEIRRQLLPIPNRGCFSTASFPAPSGCAVNIQVFCRANRAGIASILRQERGPDGLHTFVETHDLLRAGHSVAPGIYSHHVFVAEVAGEVMRA